MSPDTLPAPPSVRRDTQALQPSPPPLVPSHPSGLWGQCHNAVMMPELWVLVRGDNDGGVERRKRGNERRGIKPQLDPQEHSFIYLYLLFCILLTTHCRSWAKNHQLSTDSVFFRQKEQTWGAGTILPGYRQILLLICKPLHRVIRHPFKYEDSAALQPRGYYYLIPSQSCTCLQFWKGWVVEKNTACSTVLNPRYR